MLQGREIDAQGLSEGSNDSSRAAFDTHTRPLGGKSGGSELSGHLLGEIGGVRTDVQVRPFEGFATGEVVPNNQVRLVSEGERTPQLAVPPAWTEHTGLPCVPMSHMSTMAEQRQWHDRWDTSSDEDAAEACAGCPVKAACLLAATEEERGLHHSNRYLVRGGLTRLGRWRLEQGTLDPTE